MGELGKGHDCEERITHPALSSGGIPMDLGDISVMQSGSRGAIIASASKFSRALI